MRFNRFAVGGADSGRCGADSSRAFDSVCDVRLALAKSEGVEWTEGEEIRSTLKFPSAKTTHFAAMFNIGNSAVDEFARKAVRPFGITGSRESTAEVN